MTTRLAFVGDIHGNVTALRGMVVALSATDAEHVVLLGDYINKGTNSAEVLEDLVALSSTGQISALAGNHEAALVDAIERRDLSSFLKMGGAMTIRSYVRGRVGPDVMGEFLASLPLAHLELLQAMCDVFETEDVIAAHLPSQGPGTRFRVSAHLPVGKLPRIAEDSAQIDTGCGSEGGRLTALLWPSREIVQVDNSGTVIADDGGGAA